MLLLENQENVAEYLLNKNISCIGIYGGGVVAQHLIRQLDGSKVSVSFVIDNHIKSDVLGIQVYRLSEKLPEVDAIIVTPIYDYDNIKIDLEKIGIKNIVSMESLFS